MPNGSRNSTRNIYIYIYIYIYGVFGLDSDEAFIQLIFLVAIKSSKMVLNLK
jgi:hypothetical protein